MSIVAFLLFYFLASQNGLSKSSYEGKAQYKGKELIDESP